MRSMFGFSGLTRRERRCFETYVETVPLTRTDAGAPDQVDTRATWSIDFVGMGLVVSETAAAAGRAKRAALLNEGNIILSVASRRQSSRMTRTCCVSEDEKDRNIASTYIRTMLIIN